MQTTCMEWKSGICRHVRLGTSLPPSHWIPRKLVSPRLTLSASYSKSVPLPLENRLPPFLQSRIQTSCLVWIFLNLWRSPPTSWPSTLYTIPCFFLSIPTSPFNFNLYASFPKIFIPSLYSLLYLSILCLLPFVNWLFSYSSPSQKYEFLKEILYETWYSTHITEVTY